MGNNLVGILLIILHNFVIFQTLGIFHAHMKFLNTANNFSGVNNYNKPKLLMGKTSIYSMI